MPTITRSVLKGVFCSAVLLIEENDTTLVLIGKQGQATVLHRPHRLNEPFLVITRPLLTPEVIYPKTDHAIIELSYLWAKLGLSYQADNIRFCGTVAIAKGCQICVICRPLVGYGPTFGNLSDLRGQVRPCRQPLGRYPPVIMTAHRKFLTVAILCVASAVAALAQSSSNTNKTADPLSRIRDEGLNRSQVMETITYLTDVIGPRLTGSRGMKHANAWTRDQLSGWGLTNAQLEPWGPFGRGWTLKSFSAQLIEPEVMPLIALPKAWSPGLEVPLVADVIHLDGTNSADFAKYKGKLKGAIVLLGPGREIKPRFTPTATRLNETNLLRLANAGPPGARAPLPSEVERPSGRPSSAPTTNAAGTNSAATNLAAMADTLASATNRPSRTNAPPGSPRSNFSRTAFAMAEGAALIVTPSSGDSGTVFVESAATSSGSGSRTNAGRSAWSTNSAALLPQFALATEHYNRLVRLAKRGEKLRMKVDLRADYEEDDLMAYNTVAEIPGRDLADELVMLGAHLDSWHGGTGATDNAAGVAVCMEAVRILRAVDVQPRRTIRIALWSGEEQGLLGSRAYVAKHFGYSTNLAANRTASDGGDSSSDEQPTGRTRRSRRAGEQKIIHGPDYDRLSAYFNIDNGGGKIRGIYLQGNEACRPIFRRWLGPFADLGAETITASNTGGTDHQSFDGIGLPGFQFIQDGLDYWTLTHHSNMDVLDRIVPEDLKQASVIMAAFLYQAAMADEKLPRKPGRVAGSSGSAPN